jgi:putative Ca2+/H+ antiporter (TMEM165/GDT1 family)
MNFVGTIFITLLILKLAGVSISWFVVFVPIWIIPVSTLILFIIFGIILNIGERAWKLGKQSALHQEDK